MNTDYTSDMTLYTVIKLIRTHLTEIKAIQTQFLEQRFGKDAFLSIRGNLEIITNTPLGSMGFDLE